ncbi:MAG: threonine synthase [Hyphomicrobiaceae bacterium]|nr:threonine synthase [Hyphomicrobiaceae bacterium]
MPDQTNEIRYVSTRGTAPSLGFEDVMLTGLARDGGLYVPDAWPRIAPSEIGALSGLSYAEVATRIMKPYIGSDIPESEFEGLVEAAYATFSHSAVAPLVELAPNQWVLELFHGPTLAFKDVAMQLLARLMDRALTKRGRRATIVGATSGDTGGAAIEAFAGLKAIEIFILHPHGRVSDVQRRQMTSCDAENVHNIAVEGTFDDCQALVKALFNDLERRDRLSLAGVNSINWARIMAQTVYYFTSAVALGAPERTVSFCVPTGNFGDVFAGYAASRMGLPVGRLVIATNTNDILARTLKTGRYEPKDVVATSSPSMDIQVSSNFERLIFEAAGRDGDRVCTLMKALADDGNFTLAESELTAMSDLFLSEAVNEKDVGETIGSVARETGYVCDPHTAVGIAAARRVARREEPMVTLATAHPAKFPDAVAAATGSSPGMPERLQQRLGAEEHYDVIANDYDTLTEFIESRTRAIQEPAT